MSKSSIKESAYLTQILVVALLSVFIFGCVKPPEDDVALIKELLVKFERGLKEEDLQALGSVMDKRNEEIASQLISDFSGWGDLKNIYIASKKFTIVKDSAKVELTLSMHTPEGGDESEEPEKPVNLFLNKKKGKWRIKAYKIATDD